METRKARHPIALAVLAGFGALIAALFVGNAPRASAQPGPFDCDGPLILGVNNGYISDPDGVGPVVLVDTAMPMAADSVRTYVSETELLTSFTESFALSAPGNRYVLRFPNQVAPTYDGTRVILTGDISEVADNPDGTTTTVDNPANGTYIVDYSLIGGETFYTPSIRSVAGAVNPQDGLYYFGAVLADIEGVSSLTYQTYEPGTGAAPTDPVVAAWRDDNIPPGANGDFLFDLDGRLLLLASGQSFQGYRSTTTTAPYTDFVEVVSGSNTGLNGLAFGPEGEIWLSSGAGIVSIEPFEGTGLQDQVDVGGFNDLGDCMGPNLFVLQKDFPRGRATATDQVTLKLSQESLPDGRVEEQTTSGSDVGLQANTEAVIGPFLVLDESVFRIAEYGAGSTDLSPYDISYACTADDTPLVSGTLEPDGDELAALITVPNGVASIVCTITNNLAAELVLEKSVAAIEGAAAGDQIDYLFTVTNSGDVTIDNIVLSDPLTDNESCPKGALAPGEAMECTASYTLNQEDVDACLVDNKATVNGTDNVGGTVSAESEASASLVPTAELEVTKVGAPTDPNGNGKLDLGEVVEYTITVENTGEETVDGLVVSDPNADAEPDCPTGPLAPGDAVECLASHTVTEADVIAGEIENEAIATATGRCSGAQAPGSGGTVVPVDQPGGISVEKTGVSQDGKEASQLKVGDLIDYTFTVTNTGLVTLREVAVTDSVVGAASCPGDTLEPGESFDCTATYALTQTDIDNGGVVNVAAATGTTPTGETVEDEDDFIIDILPEDPTNLEVTKTGIPVDIDGDGLLEAGEYIDYSILVENVGSVTITDLKVEDSKAGPPNCGGVTVLAPGESVTCTVRYTVTQADVDAGEVLNVATATGKTPDGTDVSDKDDEDTEIPTSPQFDFTKRPPTGELEVDNTLTYEFVVVNTGLVTLTDLVVVDSLISNVTCPATELRPGDSTTCFGTYVVTAQDIEAGSIVNTATATAKDPDGNEVTRQDDQRVDVDKPQVIIIQKPVPPVVKPVPPVVKPVTPAMKPTSVPTPVPPKKPKPALALTGSNPIAPAAVAAGLVLLGFTALGVTRKRIF